MKIAVVGSGISGLTAAHDLSRDHEVWVFESEDRLGGHTHTVSVELHGRVWRVDTGFIVFNERTYPALCRLFDELGVSSKPTAMSFAIRNDRTNVEYNGSSLDQLFAQRRNVVRPSFLGMVRDLLRFYREAPKILEGDSRISVAEYLGQHRYGESFVENHLLPLGASLWSCPPSQFLQFPMRFLMTFFVNHGMVDLKNRPIWRVVEGGSSRYLAPLTEPFRERIQSMCPVRMVERRPDRVELGTADGTRHAFDGVVVACHADDALALLTDPSDTERDLLSAFTYQRNPVVLHTDTRVLPKRRKVWGAWNYLITTDNPERATITYNMNILQGLAECPETFCVSLNQADSIEPSRVLRQLVYSHPLYTLSGEAAHGRHQEITGPRRTAFCGAYWGFGFHEDGVQSGLRAAAGLRASLRT